MAFRRSINSQEALIKDPNAGRNDQQSLSFDREDFGQTDTPILLGTVARVFDTGTLWVDVGGQLLSASQATDEPFFEGQQVWVMKGEFLAVVLGSAK